MDEDPHAAGPDNMVTFQALPVILAGGAACEAHKVIS
jgi:hypothetical protein